LLTLVGRNHPEAETETETTTRMLSKTRGSTIVRLLIVTMLLAGAAVALSVNNGKCWPDGFHASEVGSSNTAARTCGTAECICQHEREAQ